MASEVVIGQAALERRLAAIASAATPTAVLRNLALLTVTYAKAAVPRRTGNLGRSILVASVSASAATVAARASYAPDVEFGTRPHVITPRAKAALRFAASPAGARLSGTPRKGAAVVFAARVNHPGTKPHPFLMPAAQKAASDARLADPVIIAWNSGGTP